MGVTADIPVPQRPSADALLAIRNAFALGGSLAGTWVVALAVRILLPRYLGPEAFGPLSFAESFAALACVALGLGVDTYIRKEIPARPAHAADFFGGVLALRAVLAIAIGAVLFAALPRSGRPIGVVHLVLVFAAAQLLTAVADSLASLLHARGAVGGLSAVNVGAKLTWAGLIAAALASGLGLAGVAAALVAAELVRTAALAVLVRRHLGLRLTLDPGATASVLRASAPFYLNAVAHAAYARIGVSVLAFAVSDDAEVGWFAAASMVGGLTLLVTPLLAWVLVPHFSRAAARSEANLTEAIRRALELVLSLAVPISLFVYLGADVWIGLLFGASFAPAATALRLLAPMFLFTYVANVSASALIRLERGWAVTLVSLAGLLVNLVSSAALAGPGLSLLGPGGGGAGVALAMVLAEAGVAAALVLLLGGRSFDRRSLGSLARAVPACAAAVLVNRLFADLGPLRLAPAALLYVVVAGAGGALRLGEIASAVRAAFKEGS